MFFEDNKGTKNRYAGTSKPASQPTGPILPSVPSQAQQPLTKRFNGKPAIETLRGILLPDQNDFDAGNGNRNVRKNVFDAELNREKETLTLIVKLKFNFKDLYQIVNYIEHKGETGYPVLVPLKEPLLWDKIPRKKEAFIYRFIQLIEGSWSYRMRLFATNYCNEPVKIYKTAIRIIPVLSGEHHSVEVNLKGYSELKYNKQFNETLPSTEISSYYNLERRALILVESDIVPILRPANQYNMKQFSGRYHATAAHEFGHAIGLHHINQKAADRDSTKSPYGETVEQKEDMMGIGGIVSPADMHPFLVALYYFTGCRWEAKT